MDVEQITKEIASLFDVKAGDVKVVASSQRHGYSDAEQRIEITVSRYTSSDELAWPIARKGKS